MLKKRKIRAWIARPGRLYGIFLSIKRLPGIR
jgi:hypothetical protein